MEAEVALLKKKTAKKNSAEEPWWEQIVGTFADDAAHEEAMRLGREYRLSQREDYDKEGKNGNSSHRLPEHFPTRKRLETYLLLVNWEANEKDMNEVIRR